MYMCLHQVAYFLSWPVLGSAIILVMTPSEEKMKQARSHAASQALCASSLWQPDGRAFTAYIGAGEERDSG